MWWVLLFGRLANCRKPTKDEAMTTEEPEEREKVESCCDDTCRGGEHCVSQGEQCHWKCS